jgi:hypothetical protein
MMTAEELEKLTAAESSRTTTVKDDRGTTGAKRTSFTGPV